MQRGGESLDQQRLLFRKDGAEVEDKPVILDAGDDRDARGSAAKTLFEFRRGIAGARDSNDFRWKRFGRRGAPSRERTAIRDFDLDLIKRKFGTQLTDEILRATFQFLRSRPNHSNSRNFIPSRS